MALTEIEVVQGSTLPSQSNTSFEMYGFDLSTGKMSRISPDRVRDKLLSELYIPCNAQMDITASGGKIELTLLEEGGHVVIEVADNGKGIRKKDIRNVFTPGFTTKQRGWGLGLSLARRIVEDYHKGKIFVKSSELGKGTTFRIEL